MMTIAIWLFKNSKFEIKAILITLFVLITLPMVSVVVVASSGIQLVGDALAYVNPVTKLVELFDTEGNKVAEIELTTNWPATGYVSDEFGSTQQWRLDWGLGMHTGIDIANEVGTPITPFMDGSIVYVDNVDDSACGKGVKVRHDHNITSLYCHMSYAEELPEDTPVKPGDVIGYMGSTGASTGPHLHFSTYVYGILVNPRTFMAGEPLTGVNIVPVF